MWFGIVVLCIIWASGLGERGLAYLVVYLRIFGGIFGVQIPCGVLAVLNGCFECVMRAFCVCLVVRHVHCDRNSMGR